jgi:hypothetical protein
MKTDAEYADLCQRLQRRVDNWRNGPSACHGDPMPLRIRETQEAVDAIRALVKERWAGFRTST